MTGGSRFCPHSSMVIGLDLDGVCADYVGGFRPYAAAHLGVEESHLPDPTNYDMVKAWGFRDDDDFRQAHLAGVRDNMLANLQPIAGAVEVLQQLAADGAHIRVVSHRLFLPSAHYETVRQTAEWLDKQGIPYGSLCLTGLKDSVGADIYFEDAPENIAALTRQGIPVIVVDQPWNAGVEAPRLFDWAQAPALIDQTVTEWAAGC